MPTVSRRVVYMLLTAILVLLLGITALLTVAHNRHQRMEDVTTDLQRNLTQQESKIEELQERLEDCDTLQAVLPADHSWNTKPSAAQSAKTPVPATSPSSVW